jgi:hypothetical protein
MSFSALFYWSATIRSGSLSLRLGRSRSKISVAALNFGAEFSANASPNRTGRTQLTPLLGLDPNNDPGLAGETGLSRD